MQRFNFSHLNEEDDEQPTKKFDFSHLNEGDSDEEDNQKPEEPSILRKVISHSPIAKLANAGSILGGDLAEAGKNALLTTVAGAPGVANQVIDEPSRFGKNVGGGFLGLSKKLLNTPHDLPKLLAHLGLIPEETGNKVSGMIPEAELQDDVAAFYGKPKSETDKFVRGVVENADILAPVGKMLKPGQAITNVKKAFPNLKSLESELQGAEESHIGAQEANKQMQGAAQRETGQANPNLMENKNVKHQEELTKLNENLLKEEEPINPTSRFLDTPREAEMRLEKAHARHEEALKHSENAENDIASHLESGAEHDVRAARIFKNKLENNKTDIQNDYKSLEKDFEDKNVVIDNSEKIKKLTTDLKGLVQEAGGLESNSGEIQRIGKELNSMSKREIIPAKEFVSAYKSVNGYVRESFKKAFEPGINEETRNLWKKRGEEAKSKLSEMDEILKDSLGEEDYGKFKKTSSRWRDEIVPLYSEPVYWQIMEKERLPKDMISTLRGGKKGSGIEIIRNIAHNDPQALKHIVGQKYDANPKNLHEPNEAVSQYLEKMPELKNLLETKNKTNELVDRSKKHIEANENAKSQSEKMKKTFEEKIGKRKEWQTQKDQIEKSISLLEKHIPELQKAAANEKLAFKDKLAAKHRLQKAKVERSKARKKLVLLGSLISAPIAGGRIFQGVNKTAKLLSKD